MKNYKKLLLSLLPMVLMGSIHVAYANICGQDSGYNDDNKALINITLRNYSTTAYTVSGNMVDSSNSDNTGFNGQRAFNSESLYIAPGQTQTTWACMDHGDGLVLNGFGVASLYINMDFQYGNNVPNSGTPSSHAPAGFGEYLSTNNYGDYTINAGFMVPLSYGQNFGQSFGFAYNNNDQGGTDDIYNICVMLWNAAPSLRTAPTPVNGGGSAPPSNPGFPPVNLVGAPNIDPRGCLILQ